MRPNVHRIVATGADASAGRVVVDPAKACWNGSLLASSAVLAPLTFSVEALLVFLASTYLTLLLGHSVGMHRRMIHKSFDCPKWLERILVYLGVVVGMAGPFGLLRIHDVRDWAQREPHCHDFFAHRRSLLLDAFWQLTCRFELAKPPRFAVEPEFANDPWYHWLERTWMLQQIPVAALLFAIGGLPWVVWGVCLRVTVSVTGHWVVTYLTHNPGPGRWHVLGAGVQASNLAGYGLLTMGECWHNNHHAFPESARIGLQPAEADPAWWIIQCMQRIGLATRVGLPREDALREDLAEEESDMRERPMRTRHWFGALAICALVASTVVAGSAEAQRNRRNRNPPDQPPPSEYVAPEDATRIVASASVIVEFTITAEGTTKDIVVVESTDAAFNDEAVQAVRGFRYRPKIERGQPVERRGVKTKVTFQLEEDVPSALRRSGPLVRAVPA